MTDTHEQYSCFHCYITIYVLDVDREFSVEQSKTTMTAFYFIKLYVHHEFIRYLKLNPVINTLLPLNCLLDI